MNKYHTPTLIPAYDSEEHKKKRFNIFRAPNQHRQINEIHIMSLLCRTSSTTSTYVCYTDNSPRSSLAFFLFYYFFSFSHLLWTCQKLFPLAMYSVPPFCASPHEPLFVFRFSRAGQIATSYRLMYLYVLNLLHICQLIHPEFNRSKLYLSTPSPS